MVEFPTDCFHDFQADEQAFEISALDATTNCHDGWLHRGTFLFDMDFHSYVRFTMRSPRAKSSKVTDADRAEHAFLLTALYLLSTSHWQVLKIDGLCTLVMMEALRCPPASLNNGEDNAVFKSLIGTLIKCPGPGQCANPLFCKAGFFQVEVPESAVQTPAANSHVGSMLRGTLR